MTGIDNGLGLGIGMALTGNTEYLDHVMLFKDSKLYGESASPDCPQNGRGGFCIRYDKCGLMSAISFLGPKPIHPTIQPLKPYHKTMSFATWAGIAIFENFEFINFHEKTKEGGS
jgi:hypothetical protein